MLCCRKQDTDNPDLTVQLDVFEQWKTNDDEQLTAPDGVDLNDHLNVFHAVFKQVSHVTPGQRCCDASFVLTSFTPTSSAAI